MLKQNINYPFMILKNLSKVDTLFEDPSLTQNKFYRPKVKIGCGTNYKNLNILSYILLY